MREQADLATMMSFVREHVGKHGGAGGPGGSPSVSTEFHDAAARIGEGFGEHPRATPGGFGQGGAGLALCAASAMKWVRQFDVRSGETQPLATDVVNVREDSGERTKIAARGRGVPGARMEMG